VPEGVLGESTQLLVGSLMTIFWFLFLALVLFGVLIIIAALVVGFMALIVAIGERIERK
jgi:hypothetical protein